MPHYDFEGPIRYFFGGDIWKFPTGEQNIKFLDGQGPILIALKFLDGLNPLIYIFLPGDDIIDNPLNLVNVVGLVVYFPEGFDIILPFLNKKSIPAFRVIFELVDSFVDFFLEFFADSFDKLVEFDQIIVFSQLLLDIKMLGFGGPVVHPPQIFFLQFLQRD